MAALWRRPARGGRGLKPRAPARGLSLHRPPGSGDRAPASRQAVGADDRPEDAGQPHCGQHGDGRSESQARPRERDDKPRHGDRQRGDQGPQAQTALTERALGARLESGRSGRRRGGPRRGGQRSGSGRSGSGLPGCSCTRSQGTPRAASARRAAPVHRRSRRGDGPADDRVVQVREHDGARTDDVVDEGQAVGEKHPPQRVAPERLRRRGAIGCVASLTACRAPRRGSRHFSRVQDDGSPQPSFALEAGPPCSCSVLRIRPGDKRGAPLRTRCRSVSEEGEGAGGGCAPPAPSHDARRALLTQAALVSRRCSSATCAPFARRPTCCAWTKPSPASTSRMPAPPNST